MQLETRYALTLLLKCNAKTLYCIVMLCPLLLFLQSCRFFSKETKEPAISAFNVNLDTKKVFGAFPVVDETINEKFLHLPNESFQEKEMTSYTERLSGLSCHKKEDLVSCFAGKRIADLMLDPKQNKKEQLPSDLASQIWQMLEKVRPEVETEPKITAELLCRIYKEDLPPYKKGLSLCFIYEPSKPKEAYLDDASSYMIASSLKGNEPFKEPEDHISGSAICQWKSSGHHECTLDGQANMTSSSYLKLDKKIGNACYQKVKEIYIRLEPSLLQKPVVHLPPEQMFHLFCKALTSKDTQPTASCRISLP